MQCPVCGNTIQREDAVFCPNCGSPLVTKHEEAINEETVKEKPINEEPVKEMPDSYEPDIKTDDKSDKNKSVIGIAAIVTFGLIILALFTFNLGKAVGSKTDSRSVSNMSNNDMVSDGSKGEAPDYEDLANIYNDDFENKKNKEIVTEPPAETTTEEKESTYEIFFADFTWNEAKEACESKGGHLVTIDSSEEWDKIVSMVSGYDIKCVYYIGAERGSTYDYYWIDKYGEFYGSPINSNSNWLSEEPSFYDNASGLQETCTSILYHSSSGRWVWNDIPNDYLSVASYKSGKVGYICEYD